MKKKKLEPGGFNCRCRFVPWDQATVERYEALEFAVSVFREASKKVFADISRTRGGTKKAPGRRRQDDVI